MAKGTKNQKLKIENQAKLIFDLRFLILDFYPRRERIGRRIFLELARDFDSR